MKCNLLGLLGPYGFNVHWKDSLALWPKGLYSLMGHKVH